MVGDQAGQRRDGDLGRRMRADVEPDRPVHPGYLVGRNAEPGECRDMRRGVIRLAHHSHPAGLRGQRIADHDAEFRPVVIGNHHVSGVVERRGHRGLHRETRVPRGLGLPGVRLHQHRAESGVAAEMQQVAGYRREEHRDERPPVRDQGCVPVRDSAGRVLVCTGHAPELATAAAAGRNADSAGTGATRPARACPLAAPLGARCVARPGPGRAGQPRDTGCLITGPLGTPA